MKNVYFLKKLYIVAIILIFIDAGVLTSICVSGSENKQYLINDNNENGLKIITEKVLFSKPVIVSNGIFVYVKLAGANSNIFIPQEPILPEHNVIFKLPFGAEVLGVECSISSISSMVLSRKVTPASDYLKKESFIVNSGFIFNSVYQSFDLYPSNWYSFHEGGGLDGRDHVTYLSIQLYPVRYSPRLNEISFAGEFSIEVKYKEPVKQFFNFRNSKDTYNLLIITPSKFSENILPLVAHKNKYGISTKMVSLEEIYNGSIFPVQGRDYAEKIKYFIKNAIENWNISFVFLIGGCDELPVRLVSSASSQSITTFISDLYYADIYSSDGSFCSWDSNNNSKFGEIKSSGEMIDYMDLYPDVYIGRIPCTSTNELDIVVNKIINYEQETYNQSWFKNLVLCGGDTFNNILVEWILGAHASEGIYTGDKVASVMKDFNPVKLYANFANLIFKTKYLPLPENINNALNNGAGFVLFSGHGDPTTWMTHPPLLMSINLLYKSSDIINLNNNKLPIMVLYDCSNGDYSKETGVPSPIAWEFVKKEGGGAIATFAATTLALSTMGTYCLARVSGYITLHLFQAYKSGSYTPGMMLVQAQTDYLNDKVAMQFHEVADYFTIEEWALFGDPSLKIGGYPSN